MAAFPTTPPNALRFEPGPPRLLRSAIDPLIAMGLLALAVAFGGESFDAPYLILALLVFSMTYPGGLARFSVRPAALAAEILGGWGAMMALLLMLGWATGTLELFDPRVLILWGLSTPLALFAA